MIFDHSVDTISPDDQSVITIGGSGGLSVVGPTSSTAFSPTGSAAPTNGMYLPAGNTIGISTAGVLRAQLSGPEWTMFGTTSGSALVGTASSTGGAAIRGISTAGIAFVDLDGTPINGSTDATVRLFRTSVSAATSSLDVHSPNTATVTARIRADGVMHASAGTAGAPSFAILGDTDTGTFSPTTNTLAFAAGGTEYMRVSPTGVVSLSGNVAATNTTTGTLVVTGGAGVSGTVYAGGFNGPLTGNASTATTLQTARTINGVSFNGSANITVTAAAGTLTGSTLAAGVTASSLTSVGTLTGLTVNGTILHNSGSSYAISGFTANSFQNSGTTGDSGITLSAFPGASTTASDIQFIKSRGGTGVNTVVVSGDNLGQIAFGGADGTAYIPAASIAVQVDGTPGTNDMPGRITFSTTADGASAVTERMRIDSRGNVGVGTTSPSNFTGYTAVETDSATNGGIFSVKKNGTVIGYMEGSSGLSVFANATDLKLKAGGAFSIQFQTNGLDRAQISSTGVVTMLANVASTTTTTGTLVITGGLGVSGAINAANLTTTGATTFDGVATFNAVPILQTGPGSAQLEWRENDQVLPAGRWRWTADADTFSLRHNTAVAGDFSTYTNAIAVSSANNVTFPADVTATGGTTVLDVLRASTTNLTGVTAIGSANAAPANTQLFVDRLNGNSVLPALTAGTVITLAGSSAASSPCHLQLISGNTSLGSIRFGDTDAAFRGAIQYDHSTDALTFTTAGTTAMTLDATGNAEVTGYGRFGGAVYGLGVGTRTGGVYGGAGPNTARDDIVIESNGSAGISILTPNTNTGSIVFGDPESNIAGRLDYRHTTNDFALVASGVTNIFGTVIDFGTRLSLLDTAASGATASTAGDALVIDASVATGISILTPNTTTGNIYFGDPEDNDVGRIVYNHNTNTMSFVVAAGTQLSLTTDLATISARATVAPGAVTNSVTTAIGSTVVVTPSTFTDNSTAASGTIAVRTACSIAAPTFAASNTSVTYTNASAVYIAGPAAAGTNVTLTNAHSLHVASGRSQFPQGSATAPSLAVRDENTGIYSSATNTLNVTTNGTLAATFASNGDFTAVGNVTANSDRRIKKDIQPIRNALDKLKTLSGVVFARIDTEQRGIGLIAQDVEQVFPEAVVTGEDELQTKSIAYGNLVGAVVEALKELDARLAAIEERFPA